MNKITWIIIILIILIGGYFLLTPSEPADKETIKIGAVLPFTGSSGITGESSKNGLELAREDFNNGGGLNGREIEIIYEDSQTKTDIGLSAFRKLIEINNIKEVFTSVSGVAVAISPIANEKGIIQMDIVSASPSYSTPNDFTFRTGVSVYYFAEEMGRLLFSKNIKEVGLLFVNTEYGKGYRDVFVDSYEKAGGKIVIVESYNQDDTDFRTQISKIKTSGISSLVLISLQKETPTLLIQMDQLEFDLPIYTDVYAAELDGNLETKISENLIYLKPIVGDDRENNTAKTFREKYLEKFGKEPDFIAAQAYDGFNLVMLAMTSCDSYENTGCIKGELASVEGYDGAIGKDLSLDENGDVSNRKLGVKTIKNGEFVKYEAEN